MPNNSPSLKKSSAELKKILTNGQINGQDIQYQEQLGHGNGGTVYKAYHLLGNRVLAVKVIPLDITVELQKQIMSELEILYKCDSSYIITFYSAFFVENRISICTEYMDGGSLDVYRRIPEHVLGRISVAVVKGLTYLWSLKILHRDVKPSNMLVNTRGQVKLCDFGVSTQLVNSIAKTYVGTNAYMAPERISGEQYGIHSDVWSVGISFMESAVCSYSLVSSLQLPYGLWRGEGREPCVFRFGTQPNQTTLLLAPGPPQESLERDGSRTSLPVKPSPNPDDAGPNVRHPMGFPVAAWLRQSLDSNPESLVAQLALRCRASDHS
ncbi:dual specificity mitogen-activated protein kinase kinase 5-like [Oncorhynchus nerka]|uniref:dual specificity mitogen-activated protein kinase kinase 5-like n=1 Tax=Oncorhynchus nerka TaxID=8023 RepID=UPI0031B8AFAF